MQQTKKILLLGGSRYILPIIDLAHELGLYVITADYIPNNIAHSFSDEYINISVKNKEQVLEEAIKRNINGVLSFACDPGVVTAAYVAENLNLPFQCSYKTACILQDKGLFREFLSKNGFNCPNYKKYTFHDNPPKDIEKFNWPIIVKPVDSSGSKGVTRLENPKHLKEAINMALQYSCDGSYIIEDFLDFEGFHSSSDAFTIDGDLRFITYSDQLFDSKEINPLTPAYIIFPSTMKQKYQNYLTAEIQRLMNLLEIKTGLFNIETCVSDGSPYIMEISPRGGGCKIAELQDMAYNMNLIELEVKKAVGIPINYKNNNVCDGHWCELVVHSKTGARGFFNSISLDSTIIKKYSKVIDINIQKGDYVGPFSGANMSIGDMIFKFESREELEKIINKESEWLHIKLD